LRLSVLTLCTIAIASPAMAQTHQRHTPAHDSAHAIMLDEAQHLALHQLLLGHWTGSLAPGDGHRRDTLDVHFENDSLHQQLRVRHREGVADFQIRGDTLRWNQTVAGAPCVVSTRVSKLVEAAMAKAARPRIDGWLTCGENQSAFTLAKTGL
jgi:hypothetical protein